MWQPGWGGNLGENGYMCIYKAGSHLCLSETIMTLLINCTPTQNVKFFFLKKTNQYLCIYSTTVIIQMTQGNKISHYHCLKRMLNLGFPGQNLT